jgi:hypothetical protein
MFDSTPSQKHTAEELEDLRELLNEPKAKRAKQRYQDKPKHNGRVTAPAR